MLRKKLQDNKEKKKKMKKERKDIKEGFIDPYLYCIASYTHPSFFFFPKKVSNIA